MSEPGKISANGNGGVGVARIERTKSSADFSNQVRRIYMLAGGNYTGNQNMTPENRARYERALRTLIQYQRNISNTRSYKENDRLMDSIVRQYDGWQNVPTEVRNRVFSLDDENFYRQYPRSVYARKNRG